MPSAVSTLRRDGPVALLVAAVVLAAQWPFRQLGVSLLDEGAVLQIAADVAHGKVPYRDGFHYVFPGVFYLTAGAFGVAGTSVETARALACTIFACATAVAYLVARWFVPRPTALAIAGMLLVYRVWAYPQWQLIHYSSLSSALLLLATWLVGESLIGRGSLVLAGATSGLAVLAKQDSGGLGTVALGIAILLLEPRRVRSAAAFSAGWLLVVGRRDRSPRRGRRRAGVPRAGRRAAAQQHLQLRLSRPALALAALEAGRRAPREPVQLCASDHRRALPAEDPRERHLPRHRADRRGDEARLQPSVDRLPGRHRGRRPRRPARPVGRAGRAAPRLARLRRRRERPRVQPAPRLAALSRAVRADACCSCSRS
jgi:hypothetical protein